MGAPDRKKVWAVILLRLQAADRQTATNRNYNCGTIVTGARVDSWGGLAPTMSSSVAHLVLGALALSLRTVSAISDMELTYQTFDGAVFRSGVSRAFVAFHTDDCRDCLLMESQWEEMGEEHEESTALLMGKVNCQAVEGSWAKLLCDRYKVASYPTLLYFTPPLPEPDFYYYRSSEQLHEFAKNLSTACAAAQLDRCTPGQRADLKEWLDLPKDQLSHAAGMVKYDLEKANYDRLTAEKELAALEEGGGGSQKTAKRRKKLQRLADEAADKLVDLFEHFGPRYLLMRSVQASQHEAPAERPVKERMATRMPTPKVIQHEPEVTLSKAEHRKFQRQMQEMQKGLFGGKDPTEVDWAAVQAQMKGMGLGGGESPVPIPLHEEL